MAREIPSAELFKMPEILEIPAEVLVYGASVIHHSKRPLLQNYYNFTHIDDEKTRKRDLFLAEPSDPESHYSIFEDNHGTHIFANNDLDLMTKLTELVEHGFTHWKLEGLYTPGQNFIEIAKLFIQARSLIQEGNFSHDQAFLLDEEVRKLHPKKPVSLIQDSMITILIWLNKVNDSLREGRCKQFFSQFFSYSPIFSKN